MHKKAIIGFILLFFVMLLSSFASGSTASGLTQVATDPQSDVIEYSWNNNIPTTSIGQSKPNIDIVSLSYGVQTMPQSL